MSLSGLLAVIAADPQLRHALELADGETSHPALSATAGADFIGPPALRPFLAASAAYFPPWETLPHERLSPRADTSGQRIAVLRRLARPDGGGDPRSGPLTIVTTPVRGLLQPIVGGLGELEPVRLQAGQEADLDEIVVRLVDIGYARTDLVANRGDLAVRGGILDVFPPTAEHPVRIEFWGDTIEDVRFFRVADQRSLQTAADGLWAPPCRELLLTPAVRERAKELEAEHPGLSEVLGKLADGITVEGMEAFAPVLADRMDLLLDYVPAGGCVLACDPERIRARAADLVRTSQEFLEASWVNAAAGAEIPIDLGAAVFQPITRVRAAAAALGLPWWTIAPFQSENSGRTGPTADPGPGLDAADADDETSRHSFLIEARPAEAYRGDTARVLADVRQWLAGGWRAARVARGHGPAQRLAELLRGEGLGTRAGDLSEPPEPGVAQVTTGMLEHGFSWPSVRLAVLSESDLAGQRAGTRDGQRMPSRRRGGIDPLQLTSGDYIVHEQHGVGRYLEMTSRTVQGATREYLVIE